MRLTKILLAGVLAVTFTAGAQTNTIRSLSLQECIQMALEHNLDLRIVRVEPEISKFNLAGTYSFYDPTLDLSAVHNSRTTEGVYSTTTFTTLPSNTTENNAYGVGLSGATPIGLSYNASPFLNDRSGSSFSPYYDSQAGISLRQSLLRNFWIDAGRQNILVAKKNLKISESVLVQQIMVTINQVEQAYYDLIFTRENITVQQKALELSERLANENQRRVEVGSMAPLEEKQAASQFALSRSDLLLAQQSYSAQQNVLKSLLTDDFRVWQNIEIDPAEKLSAFPETFNLLESWQNGVTQRPELQQLKLDLEKRDITLKFYHNQMFPSLDLVGSYGHNGLSTTTDGIWDDTRRGHSPFYSYGVVFSIPLSNRGPKNAWRASKSEKEQALLRYKKLEQDILVQIDDSIKLAQTSFARVDSTKAAREYAEAALQAEQKKLEAGKSTSFVVLQLQRDLTAARYAEIRALADYNKSLAQLAYDEGENLERNKLHLETK